MEKNHHNNNFSDSPALPETSAMVQSHPALPGLQTEQEATGPPALPPLNHNTVKDVLHHPLQGASFYVSTMSTTQTSSTITVHKLCQNLLDSGIHAPRRCNESKLLKLYSTITSPTLASRGNSRNTGSCYAPYPQPTISLPELEQPVQEENS